MVAASPKETSLNLIKHAGNLSKSSHADLDILCILSKTINQDLINEIREVSKENNGNLFLVKDLKRSISDELVHYIKSNRITQVVMGYSKTPHWKQFFSDSKVFRVLEQTSNLDILIINSNKKEIDDKLNNEKKELTIDLEKPDSSNFGKLKIYIGMAPGVGKTYKMLQDAKELHRQGVNVLLGVIDTHGRIETAELMEGLSILPYKLIEHKGKYMQEFDLEASILAK